MSNAEVYTNQIGMVAGEALNTSFWTGDPSHIVNALAEKNIEPNQSVEYLEAMNYDRVKSKTGVSSFADVQHLFVNMLSSSTLSKNDMEMVSGYIVENPNLLDPRMQYPNLGSYGDQNLLYEQMIQLENTNEKETARTM